MSAKGFTASLSAMAMIATLSIATPVQALNQDQRNIVAGFALGVIGALTVQGIRDNKRGHKAHNTCRHPYKVYRHGRLVTVCR